MHILEIQDGRLSYIQNRIEKQRRFGERLPKTVLAQMEYAFGCDFSDVRIHEGPEAAMIRAKAFACGDDIYFAEGMYDPRSEWGQRLLGHELAHVVQQRMGRVSAPSEKQFAINSDPELEKEAEFLAIGAAQGIKLHAPNQNNRNYQISRKVVQRAFGFEFEVHDIPILLREGIKGKAVQGFFLEKNKITPHVFNLDKIGSSGLAGIKLLEWPKMLDIEIDTGMIWSFETIKNSDDTIMKPPFDKPKTEPQELLSFGQWRDKFGEGLTVGKQFSKYNEYSKPFRSNEYQGLMPIIEAVTKHYDYVTHKDNLLKGIDNAERLIKEIYNKVTTSDTVTFKQLEDALDVSNGEWIYTKIEKQSLEKLVVGYQQYKPKSLQINIDMQATIGCPLKNIPKLMKIVIKNANDQWGRDDLNGAIKFCHCEQLANFSDNVKGLMGMVYYYLNAMDKFDLGRGKGVTTTKNFVNLYCRNSFYHMYDRCLSSKDKKDMKNKVGMLKKLFSKVGNKIDNSEFKKKNTKNLILTEAIEGKLLGEKS